MLVYISYIKNGILIFLYKKWKYSVCAHFHKLNIRLCKTKFMTKNKTS